MQNHKITPERIIEAACIYFKISKAELKSRRYFRDVVYRRKICYCLIRQNCEISFQRIAEYFEIGDHANVLRSIEEMNFQKNIFTHIGHDMSAVQNIAVNLFSKQVKNGENS